MIGRIEDRATAMELMRLNRFFRGGGMPARFIGNEDARTTFGIRDLVLNGVHLDDFDVVGDGVQDDTEGFAAALLQAVDESKGLILPFGDYLLESWPSAGYDLTGVQIYAFGGATICGPSSGTATFLAPSASSPEIFIDQCGLPNWASPAIDLSAASSLASVHVYKTTIQRGQATISVGTTVTVTHGHPCEPPPGQIQVTPRSAGAFHVSAVTATTFEITGVNGQIFDWVVV